jgi:hypothetical protein
MVIVFGRSDVQQTPPARPRAVAQDWLVGAGLVGLPAILAVEGLHDDRLPTSAWVELASILAVGIAAGVGSDIRRIKLGAVGLAGLAWLVIGIAAMDADVVVGVAVLVPLVGLGLGVGSLARRILVARARLSGPRLTRLVSPRGSAIRVAVGATFVLVCLPYPLAVIERNRTVIVTHAAGRVIDERAGTFRGVGLGDRVADVAARLGQPAAYANASTTDQFGPLGANELFDGPSSTDLGSSQGDSLMRYAHVSFQIRGGRVRAVQIDDHSAATSAGVGPGDSISLVRRAYPRAVCGEDAIHAEPDYIPYPECQVALAAHRWLAFFATYRKPGVPVLDVWLSTGPLEPTR